MPVSRVGIDVEARDRASATFTKIGRSGQTAFGNLDKSAKRMMSGVVASFAIMAARSAYHMIAMGARSADTAEAFERNTARMGMDARHLLDALKAASKGTVAQFSLVASASTAMRLGVATNIETFEKLMKIASMRAKEFGYTTGEAWGFLVRGIGRASPMILDNIGYMIDATTTNEAYALAIGKTVTELTKQERQTALVNQIIRQSRDDLEAWADSGVSAADKIAIMEAKVRDLKDELMVGLAPALGATAEATTKAIPPYVRYFTILGRGLRLTSMTIGAVMAASHGIESLVNWLEKMTGVRQTDEWELMRWLLAMEDAEDETGELTKAIERAMAIGLGAIGMPLSQWLEKVGVKAAEAAEPMSWLAAAIDKATRIGLTAIGMPLSEWLEEAARATEDVAEAADVADIMEGFAALGQKYRMSYIEETTRFAKTQQNIARGLGRQLANIQRRYSRALVQLSKDEAKDRIRVAQDYAKRVIDINRKGDLARIDAQRSFGLAWQELLEEQKRARVDFERDLSAAIYEAAGKRDAVTIRRLQRQATRQRRRTRRDQAVAKRRLEAHHTERLTEIAKQRRRELEDAQRAHREQLRQLTEQMEERRIRLREQLIQQQLDARYAASIQLEDARRAHRERFDEIDLALRKEARAVETHTQAGWILWQKYYRDLIEMARLWRIEAERVPSIPEPPSPDDDPWWGPYPRGGMAQGSAGGGASTLTIALQGAVEVASGEGGALADQITQQVLAGVTAAVRQAVGGRV